ncbi:MAG TPA: hypothetical protein VF796_18360 [Humisphaera sp.]
MNRRPHANMRTLRLILVVAALCLLRPSPARAADPVDDLKKWLAAPAGARPAIDKQPFAAAPLTKAQAAEARTLLWDDHVARVKATREQEWKEGKLEASGKTMKLLRRQFGTKPAGGWNLYISLHGGGGAPPQVNDQQWQNQIRLYQPKDSLYVAPRAPTDNWNLWHEPHVDDLLDRLIEDAVIFGGVNPDRVYVMGYSAGGDGVYQLAPRMADRWAAAAMMAGHPNDASPLGLRNLPFTGHVGALDAAFKRNEVLPKWGEQLDALQKADPKGYIHEIQVHPGRAHWMNLEDAVAVDWMAKFTRDTAPERVVWKQSGVTHERFYWLAVPAGQAKAGSLVVASRDGQKVSIEKAEGVARLTVMLSDALVDLDKPVAVFVNGRAAFKGAVARTIRSLHDTLAGRGDQRSVFDGAVTVDVAAP